MTKFKISDKDIAKLHKLAIRESLKINKAIEKIYSGKKISSPWNDYTLAECSIFYGMSIALIDNKFDKAINLWYELCRSGYGYTEWFGPAQIQDLLRPYDPNYFEDEDDVNI